MYTLTKNEVTKVSGGFVAEMVSLASAASGAIIGGAFATSWVNSTASSMRSGITVIGATTVSEMNFVAAGAIMLGSICWAITWPKK